jgi:sec-independent protein translocase protein TatB
MFGIGWTEMLVIGVVALIVIGPKDLPVVMNRLGKVIGSIRRMGSEFQREINRTTGLDQITDIRKSFTEPLKQTAADIRKEFNSVASTGATVPSGVIAPKDPAAESVVDEIHERVGMSPPAPVMAPMAAAASAKVESPAPVEAIAPVRKPRKPRAKAPATSSEPSVTKPAVKAAAAKAKAPAAKAKAPAKPRKPRSPTPAAGA